MTDLSAGGVPRLPESEQRYREVVGALREAVLLVDNDLRVFDANRAAAALVGQAVEDLVGLALDDPRLGISDEAGQPLTRDHLHVARVLAGIPVLDVLVQVRHRSGLLQWVEANIVLVDPETGEVPYLVFSLRDVTGLREVNVRLQRLSDRHAMLAEINREVLRHDGADELLRAAAEVIGRRDSFSWVTAWKVLDGAAELIAEVGERDDVVAEAGLRDLVLASVAGPGRVAELAAGGSSRGVVVVGVVHAPVSYSLVMRDSGDDADRTLFAEVASSLASGLDFLDHTRRRQRAEEALRLSEARLRALLRHTIDVIATVDAKGDVTYVSPAIRDLTGDEPADVVGRPVIDVLVPEEQPEVRASLAAVVRGTEPRVLPRFRLQARDGTPRWVEVHAVPLFDDPVIQGLLIYVHDVTGVVGYLDALERSEDRYRTLVGAAPAGIAAVDTDDRITFANERLCELVGLPYDEVIGAEPAALTGPVHREQFRASFARLATGVAGNYDFELHRRDGTVRWVHITSTPLLDAAGAFAGALVIADDVTVHRRTEERLLFQAQLLDAVGEAVIATEPDGTIVYWNAAAEVMYGWPADDVLGADITDITPSAMSLGQAHELMATLRRGETWAGEFEVRRRDGTPFPAYVSDSPILDESGGLVGIIGVSFDITERVRAEQAISQRALQQVAVAAVGELAISETTVSAFYHEATAQAVVALSGKIGCLFLEDDDTSFRLEAVVGLPTGGDAYSRDA